MHSEIWNDYWFICYVSEDTSVEKSLFQTRSNESKMKDFCALHNKGTSSFLDEILRVAVLISFSLVGHCHVWMHIWQHCDLCKNLKQSWVSKISYCTAKNSDMILLQLKIRMKYSNCANSNMAIFFIDADMLHGKWVQILFWGMEV